MRLNSWMWIHWTYRNSLGGVCVCVCVCTHVRKQAHVPHYDRHCCCSVAQLCPTLWDPKDCSTPGFPVLHHLPEFAQTHVHWVSDAIQPSHPLSPTFSSCPQSFPASLIGTANTKRSRSIGQGNTATFSYTAFPMLSTVYFSKVPGVQFISTLSEHQYVPAPTLGTSLG